MSTRLGPDWKALAAAQKIELTEQGLERLEGLSKTLLGLRGLIDWTEEPGQVYRVEGPGEEAREGSK
jgi:hypothetical protein